MNIKNKRWGIIIFIVITLFALISTYLFLIFNFNIESVWPWSYIVKRSIPNDDKIEDIIQNLNSGSPSEYELIRRTTTFVYETIETKLWNGQSCSGLRFFKCYITKYPCIRIHEKEKISYLLNSKCGACGEHANLFAYFMDRFNITTSIIRLVKGGGDHAINEVFLEGKTIIVDASKNISDKPKEEETYPNVKDIWYAEGRYLNGTIFVSTREYSRNSTGKIKLKFLKGDIPFENQSIRIIRGADISITTDSEGVIEAYLGGNSNYTISFNNPLFKKEKILVLQNKELNQTIHIKANYKLIILCIILFIIVLSIPFINKIETKFLKQYLQGKNNS